MRGEISEQRAPAVAVFRSAALGDFILASPALKLLRKFLPDHRIVLVAISSGSKKQREKVAAYAGGASKMPWVELSMPHLVDDLVVIDDVKSIRDLVATRGTLRTKNIRRVVFLLDPGSPWAAKLKKMLLFLFLIGFVPMFGWRGKGSTDHKKLKQLGVLRHHVFGPMQFVSELPGSDPRGEPQVEFDLRPKTEDVAWADYWLRQRNLVGSLLVAIAPGSIQSHKRWPLEKFARTCELILSEYPLAKLLVIGTPADSTLATGLIALAPSRVFNLAGTASIGQCAAILKHCTLLVGNDGGAVHLADAMGARVVSIVPGIEYPDSIEPWNSRDLAVRHSVECSPCYDFLKCPLGHNKCMAELPVEPVMRNCRSVLNGRPRESAETSPAKELAG